MKYLALLRTKHTAVRIAGTAILSIVMLGMVSIPVTASQPTKSTVSVHFEVPGFVSCSYGDLTANITFTGFANCHPSNDGSCRTFFHVTEDIVVTNPLNGKIATGRFTWNEQATTELASSGGGINLLVDGRKVAHASGRIVFDRETFNLISITPSLEKQWGPSVCAALQ
jgi:hypothetical protein